MNIKPLQDRVIVKRLAGEEKTSGGIIIPDSAKEKPAQGEVMHVGAGKTTEEGKVLSLSVKVGDKVLFGKYAGQEIELSNETLLVMNESDIIAIVE